MSQSWALGSRYVLETSIGSGTMGQVWLGHDLEGRPLAFKLLRPELAEDAHVVTRFLQERQLITAIKHPGVIEVYDLVVEGPRLAIVMEYVDGPTLRELLNKRGDLLPVEVASLGAGMAEGLAAVHRAGVLHRDLKPENVLLTPYGAGFAPKLVDFGVAGLALTPHGRAGTANVIGTPQYLAPELGDGRPSSPAGDLYALGITLYEMACGSVPFLADSPLAVLRLHADYAPARPPGVPDELWSIISALLAKNPEDRPSDAAAVAAQLRDAVPTLAGMPAPKALREPLPPVKLPAAPHEKSRTGQTRTALIGAIAALTLVILAAILWLLLK